MLPILFGWLIARKNWKYRLKYVPNIWRKKYMNCHFVHDDVIKWKHFPRYWPFSVRGIHRSPVNSPHKGQWRGALVFSLICAWINGWVNNREAGALRRQRAHYDVIVMFSLDTEHMCGRVSVSYSIVNSKGVTCIRNNLTHGSPFSISRTVWFSYRKKVLFENW